MGVGRSIRRKLPKITPPLTPPHPGRGAFSASKFDLNHANQMSSSRSLQGGIRIEGTAIQARSIYRSASPQNLQDSMFVALDLSWFGGASSTFSTVTTPLSTTIE